MPARGADGRFIKGGGGGGISAGDAVWTITGDTQPLEGALAGAEGAVNNSTQRMSAAFVAVGAAVTAVGASITAALGASLNTWADTGAEIADMSTRTGVAADVLSKLRYVGEQADVSFEELGNAFKFLGKNLTEVATSGAGPAADALATLGISLDQIMGKSPDEQFLIIADAIAQVGDANARTALSMDIFGRSGSSLLTIMMQGKDAIREQMNEAQRLGIVYTQEGAVSAEAFGDSMNTLTNSFKGVVIAIGPAIADIVNRFVPAIQKAVEMVKDWIDANPALAASLVGIAAGVGGVFTVLGPFIMLLPGLVTAFGLVASAASALIPLFSGIISAIVAAIGAVSAPVLAVGALVGAAIALIVTNWEGIVAGLDVVWDAVVGAGEWVVDVLSQIWDAIVAVFEEGWNWIAGIIAQIGDAIGGLFGGLFGGIAGFFGGGSVPIEARASGGPVSGGMPYIVGEEGPELFVPSASGSIVPNGGGNSVTINLNNPVVRDDSDIRRISESLAGLVGRELRGMGAFA